MARRKDFLLLERREECALLLQKMQFTLSLPEDVVVMARDIIARWLEEHPRHLSKTLVACAVYLACLNYRLHVAQRIVCEHLGVSLKSLREFLRKNRLS